MRATPCVPRPRMSLRTIRRAAQLARSGGMPLFSSTAADQRSRAAPANLSTPLRLRGLTLANRIVVAPMCQYSAQDGCMVDWHLMHLGQFAVSGAGLVMTEMT